jgi:hypothetical protein
VTEQEQREVQQRVNAVSERVETVTRANSLLAVTKGQSCAYAAREAGLKSGDSACHLVQRFHGSGLQAFQRASGHGRKATDTSLEHTRILQEHQRAPDRHENVTATWSLKTLQQTFRRTGFPRVGATTIRRALHEADSVCGVVPDRNRCAQAYRECGDCVQPTNRGKNRQCNSADWKDVRDAEKKERRLTEEEDL